VGEGGKGNLQAYSETFVLLYHSIFSLSAT